MSTINYAEYLNKLAKMGYPYGNLGGGKTCVVRTKTPKDYCYPKSYYTQKGDLRKGKKNEAMRRAWRKAHPNKKKCKKPITLDREFCYPPSFYDGKGVLRKGEMWANLRREYRQEVAAATKKKAPAKRPKKKAPAKRPKKKAPAKRPKVKVIYKRKTPIQQLGVKRAAKRPNVKVVYKRQKPAVKRAVRAPTAIPWDRMTPTQQQRKAVQDHIARLVGQEAYSTGTITKEEMNKVSEASKTAIKEAIDKVLGTRKKDASKAEIENAVELMLNTPRPKRGAQRGRFNKFVSADGQINNPREFIDDVKSYLRGKGLVGGGVFGGGVFGGGSLIAGCCCMPKGGQSFTRYLSSLSWPQYKAAKGQENLMRYMERIAPKPEVISPQFNNYNRLGGEWVAGKRQRGAVKRGGRVPAPLQCYNRVLAQVRAQHPHMAYRDQQALASKKYHSMT